MSCRPVDYMLIYRLEDERAARDRAYICSMRDWVMDFADHFRMEPWWNHVPSWPANGEIRNAEHGLRVLCLYSTAVGEIG